jgi:hypothetical protein
MKVKINNKIKMRRKALMKVRFIIRIFQVSQIRIKKMILEMEKVKFLR